MIRFPRARRLLTIVAASFAVMVSSGATYEAAMRRQAANTFEMPGRLVDVGGGRRIHIDCRGTGSPTVVFESGLDAYGSLSWAAVHDSISKTTRACAYSRAGIMWSDPSATPFSSDNVARDLHAALLAADEVPPYVLVGHSLGGPYVVTFTARYGAEVAGLVLVDASHPDQFARFYEALGRSLQPTSGLVAVGDALAWTGFVRLMPAPPPPSTWPVDIARVAPAFLPTSLHELRGETDAISATMNAAASAKTLGDRPLVVLSTGRGPSAEMLRSMGLTSEQGAKLADVSRRLHDDQATWSSRGRHEIVADASHYIQLDRPDVVIRAVREVVSQVPRTRR